MDYQILSGGFILIVDDNALIAHEIARAFEGAGAHVKVARLLPEATSLVEHQGLSAAVLDFVLADGEAERLCERLAARNIPFVVHSGDGRVGEACGNGIVVPKPADPAFLVNALVNALHELELQLQMESNKQRPRSSPEMTRQHLAEAVRLLSQGELCVADQRQRVQTFISQGHDAALSEWSLAIFGDTLQQMRNHHSVLQREWDCIPSHRRIDSGDAGVGVPDNSSTNCKPS